MQASFVCKNCGKREYPDRWGTGKKLLERRLCFTCDFWINDVLANPKTIVVKGHAFLPGPDNVNGSMRGYGGRKFVFVMNDDRREIVSHNVWSRGDVPQEFRKLLPDTATIKKED